MRLGRDQGTENSERRTEKRKTRDWRLGIRGRRRDGTRRDALEGRPGRRKGFHRGNRPGTAGTREPTRCRRYEIWPAILLNGDKTRKHGDKHYALNELARE